MARIECGFTCKDCLSFEKCSYDAYNEANLNGKSEQNLIYIADRISCKFFKNKEDYEKVRHGYWKQNPHCKRIYYCSVCGRHIEDGSNNPNEYFPYCHCGAKMDGFR